MMENVSVAFKEVPLSVYRAFSDLLGKFLVPMKLGEKCVILGKKYDNFGEK